MEKDAVFEVLPQMLWDREIPELAEGNASFLYNELKIQTILGMSQSVLKKLPAGEAALRQQWRAELIQLLAHYDRYAFWQDQVLAVLREAAIPCFVLKGSASARYYPHPEYRAMGDVDIFLSPADLDRAAAVFQERSFRLTDADVRHTQLKKDGFRLELHTVFDGYHPDSILNQLLVKRLEQVQEVSVSGCRIPVSSELENGLVLLQHVRNHFLEGLGLRQIIDWMYFADAVVDDEFWFSQLQPLARQLRLETLAVTMTKMCELYLGMQPKGKTWYAAADNALCDSLIDYIRQMGNFGLNKASERGHRLSVLLQTRSFFEICRYLQERGEQNWELLKKYPWLKPFAWLRQIVHYALHHFIRRDYSASQDLQDWKQMQQFIKQLHLEQ